MKVLAKSTILKHRMVDQIKREISIMKIVGHPNIVRLHQVLASRRKIYIFLEFVSGGELYDKIVDRGRLPENECRRYFQQLIDAVAHCHSKGVYHRDLKPENLLLDSYGNLKVSDFGLSALPQQVTIFTSISKEFSLSLSHSTFMPMNRVLDFSTRHVEPQIMLHQRYIPSSNLRIMQQICLITVCYDLLLCLTSKI
ncbi:hypothetical protein PTKIN_Ptkin03bG0162500 [Pterospermum kingtungense]